MISKIRAKEDSKFLQKAKKLMKFKEFWLRLDEFYDVEAFKGYVLYNLEPRTLYIILVRIRYKVDQFATLDKQFSYSYDNYTDCFSFKNLFKDIKGRLDVLLDNYGLDANDLVHLIVLYREVFYGDLEKLKFNGVKRTISKNVYSNVKRISPYLPLSFDKVYFGKPLKVICSGDTVCNVITLFKKPDHEGYIDFIENFNKNNYLLPNKLKSPPFHSKQLFFYKNVKDHDVIIVIDIINENKYIKKVYSLTGVFIGGVEDERKGDVIIRKFGVNTFTIKEGSVVFSYFP